MSVDRIQNIATYSRINVSKCIQKTIINDTLQLFIIQSSMRITSQTNNAGYSIMHIA